MIYELNPKKQPRRKRKAKPARRKRSRAVARVEIIGPAKIRRKVNVMKGKKRYSRRRYRRNPPAMKAALGGVTGALKDAAYGAAGIAVNKLVANSVAKMLKVDPKNSQLFQLATAAVLMPLLAKFTKVSFFATAGRAAASVALFEAGKKYLPPAVTTYLADDYTERLPFPGYSPLAELPPAAVDQFLMAEVDETGLMPVPTF